MPSNQPGDRYGNSGVCHSFYITSRQTSQYQRPIRSTSTRLAYRRIPIPMRRPSRPLPEQERGHLHDVSNGPQNSISQLRIRGFAVPAKLTVCITGASWHILVYLSSYHTLLTETIVQGSHRIEQLRYLVPALRSEWREE